MQAGIVWRRSCCQCTFPIRGWTFAAQRFVALKHAEGAFVWQEHPESCSFPRWGVSAKEQDEKTCLADGVVWYKNGD